MQLNTKISILLFYIIFTICITVHRLVIYFSNTTLLWISPHTCYDGVIMGELLVSKMGLGYLIMYGSQVFNIGLIITSVFILGIISYLMYYMICILEKKLMR